MGDSTLPLNGKDNVVAIHGGSLPAEQVLRLAVEAGLESVVVIGWTKNKDGDELYLAASDGKASDVNWLLTHAQHRLIEMCRVPAE